MRRQKNDGPMEEGEEKRLEYWKTGRMERRKNGTTKRRKNGKAKYWKVGRWEESYRPIINNALHSGTWGLRHL